MKDFKPLVTATRTPVPEKAPSFQSFLVKESFTLPTLLAVGGLIQTLVFLALPARLALVPVVFLIGRAVITTILQARSPPRDNPLLVDMIPGRATAQLPLPQAGPGPAQQQPQFGATAASAAVVAFHLGVHFNHPLGPFCPGGREIGAHFQAMTAELQARREELGMLSATTWRGTARASHNGILLVAYFRDAGGLNRFAHDRVHRDGWDWYHRFVRETGYRHFGLFHETFLSRRGEWETIYADCEPTLLGAGSVPFESSSAPGAGDGAARWIKPLVSADHPALRSQAKRMGMTLGLKEEGKEEEEGGEEPQQE